MSKLLPVSWNNPVNHLRDRVADIFERWTSRSNGEPSLARNDIWEAGLLERTVPPVDLEETDDEVVVRAEMPGLKKGDFTVELAGHRLLLRGEKKASREEKRRNYYYAESVQGAFYRAVPLPCEVDWEHARASYQHGVLRVRMPKSEAAKARRVHVDVI
jgi:HSP20 family protein